MRYILISILIILLLAQSSYSGKIELPGNNVIKDWQKSGKQLTFYRNDLYGHINGGAELFLEFGFDSLLVQDYSNKEASLSLEVYCMDSPEAALGIYLMKCGKENPSSSIKARNSTNKYQALIVKNNFYIQLNNFSGNSKSKSVMPEMINHLLAEFDDTPVLELLNILPQDNKIAGSDRIIRGPYALQPIFTFGEGDILQLNSKIFAAIADYEAGNSNTFTQIVIPYPDKSKSRKVLVNLIEKLDPYLKIIKRNDSGFIFEDYEKKYGLVRVLSNKLFISIHLELKPAL